MSDDCTPQRNKHHESIEYRLEEITDTWDSEDPTVLELPGEREPVVADVNGTLHLLHSGLIYSRKIGVSDIREHLGQHEGGPRTRPLSEFSHRFDREDFEDLHPEVA